ncbi:hypothetical protein GCM10023083_74200 [Streptomyces phyllanthi]
MIHRIHRKNQSIVQKALSSGKSYARFICALMSGPPFRALARQPFSAVFSVPTATGPRLTRRG